MKELHMPTIVEYTDTKTPQNLYPKRIISPTRSGPCCFTDMEGVGPVKRDGLWEYQFRRCQRCGFTVRVVLREVPDAALIRDIRRSLEDAFQRNVPDL
jgi:hypothetical protein